MHPQRLGQLRLLRSLCRPQVLRRVSAEIAILRSLQHPNIVCYYGHEEKDGQLRIYMEFVPQSLYQVITMRRKEERPFSALEVRQVALGVAKGLEYLHTLPRPIMHRDIKVLHPPQPPFRCMLTISIEQERACGH